MRSSSILFIWMVFSLHGHQRTESLLHRDDADIFNVKPKYRPSLETSSHPNSSDNKNKGIQGVSSKKARTLHSQRFLAQSKMRTKRKAMKFEKLRWTQATIPYEFTDGEFNSTEKKNIEAAMKDWSSTTCLTFRPARPEDTNKIKFRNGTGCSSFVGMIGGSQMVTLQKPQCLSHGTYLHELGHAIGLIHEHQRPDRDEYINVKMNNVHYALHSNFEKEPEEHINDYDLPYDYSSIMHYYSSAGANNSEIETIIVKDKSRQHEIGQRIMLSFWDNKVVNLMYQCNKKCEPNEQCNEPGYLDKSCQCICPKGVDCTKVEQVVGGGKGTGSECKNMYSDKDCKLWAANGDCERNKQWMEKHCNKSCGCGGTGKPEKCEPNEQCNEPGYLDKSCQCICPKGVDCTKVEQVVGGGKGTGSECKNMYSDKDCKLWAANGDCERNKQWMEKHCNKSCGCGGTGKPECSDAYSDKECSEWAAGGKCSSEWMGKFCKKTCGICGPAVCKNFWSRESDCAAWSKRGDCNTNPSWMKKNCAKSCASC
ncbi:zinc metalloproteinase nas-13 [Biomphalaria pfeifferi]|uniref:Metalloendopeptidase n=1 Tax=Biomphalaria pfeifferi TaxID=112525 RepID=A0AAD8C5C9_BIOPF|nr:zinc metalloproteinase nas-13 [Biomphalaria pfeifferi]